MGGCYVVYTIRHKKHLLPYAHVHFISNPRAFVAATSAAVRQLVKRHQVLGLLVEARFLSGWSPQSRFVHRVSLRRLYRSTSLRPPDIDHLYTEFTILGL
jgi:hypothetical protein